MRLSLLVTSSPTAALYQIKGRRELAHKSCHYCPTTDGDTTLIAAIRGLQVIEKHWHKLVFDETGSTRWAGLKLPITIKGNGAFIEAGQALTELEDVTGLPQNVQSLHQLLTKFTVTWRKATTAQERALRQWAERAARD